MLSPVSNRRWTGRVRVDTLPFTYSRSLFEHGRWLFPPCLSLLPRIDTTTTPIQQGSNSLDDCSFLHHCKRFRRNESKTCARCQSTQRSLVLKLSDKKRALIWRESPPSIYFNPPSFPVLRDHYRPFLRPHCTLQRAALLSPLPSSLSSLCSSCGINTLISVGARETAEDTGRAMRARDKHAH